MAEPRRQHDKAIRFTRRFRREYVLQLLYLSSLQKADKVVNSAINQQLLLHKQYRYLWQKTINYIRHSQLVGQKKIKQIKHCLQLYSVKKEPIVAAILSQLNQFIITSQSLCKLLEGSADEATISQFQDGLVELQLRFTELGNAAAKLANDELDVLLQQYQDWLQQLQLLLSSRLAEQTIESSTIESAAKAVIQQWYDVKFFEKECYLWASAIYINRAEINQKIQAITEHFSLERLLLIDQCILWMMFQEYSCQQLPAQVAINEGIEIAKAYSSEKSANFINGILDALCKTKL